ncbi:hypothetical protein DB345_21185 [Spartobacteria bacterium LR76]|nr:hypothetical protein DB345_21185 [Spartobacteria bacterium LR76]
MSQGKSTAESKHSALDALISSQSSLSPDFERYLSTPEAPKDQILEYQNLYTQALDYLDQRKPVEAWQILFRLSQFEWDADISKQIANRVRAVWDTNSTAKTLLAENDKLQGNIRTSNWNADLTADSQQRINEERAKARGDSKSPQPAPSSNSSSSVPGTLRMTEEYFKSLDSKARIKLNEVKIDNIRTKARSDLVDYITTLFKAKRYAHAVLAASFYHALFQDGELPPEVANQATASLEATRQIAKAVEAFRFKVDQKQLNTASVILEEAWHTGEYTPQMLGLPRELKLKVIEHANSVRRMRNLIEARNFEELESLLDQMSASSADFDTTKPKALIQSIKLDSRMKLGRARLFAQQGNTTKAMEEFRSAAETWPGNPDLEKASTEYFQTEDKSTKATADFDADFKRGDFRAIAEKQTLYATALQSDQPRLKQLESSLLKVKSAEIALEKSRLLETSGDYAGAWEATSLALDDWPTDPQLSLLTAKYSTRAVSFVSAISKARDAETRGDKGAAISYFALARSEYPVSRIAIDSLTRLSKDIMSPEDNDKKAKADATPTASK